MTRQIAFGYGAPSRADLENRIHALEVKVIGLTEAVALLARALEAHALENGPTAQSNDAEEIAKAARQAHETLLTRHHDVETTEDRPPSPPAAER